MSTKEKVYSLLKGSGSKFISGEEIAKEIFVTRAAVWKAIKALEKEGILIEAVTNKGYRLKEIKAVINKEAIKSALDLDYSQFEYIQNLTIDCFQTVTSTNDLARKYAKDSLSECVIISDCQTKGRGRKGRDFFSPTSTGLYMSFLLFPKADISKAMTYTCMMAESLCRAIKKVTGIDTQIKWVNDIYYKDKKIAGILTEGVTSIEDGSLEYMVIGAGINLYTPYEGFPEDIKKKAGALLDTEVTPGLREQLAAAIIGEFLKCYHQPEVYPFLSGYKEKSMLVGKYVKLLPYGFEPKDKYAKVISIDDSCRLVIEFDDGKQQALSSGEVSVVTY